MPCETTEKEFKSPPKKLLAFFQRSRDKWKAKSIECRKLLKKEKNQVRAVEKSRDQWRARAEKAEAEKRELLEQIQAQKKTATRRSKGS